MSTMKRHDLDAVHYRSNSTYQYDSAMKLIRTHSFKENDNVLDVGCGDGRITAYLAKKIAKGKVVGVDLSTSMISFAESTFQKEEYPNLSFQVSNAEDIQYNNEFDVVLSMNCLHWVQNKKKAFEKMIGSLVPGGTFLVQFAAANDTFPQFLSKVCKNERWSQYTPRFSFSEFTTLEECRELLEALPVEIIQCELKEHVSIFDTTEDLTSFMKIWANYYFPLPEELQAAYLSEVVHRIAEYARKEDNKIHLRFSAIVIRATKK